MASLLYIPFLQKNLHINYGKNHYLSFSLDHYNLLHLTTLALLAVLVLISLGTALHILATGGSPATLKRKIKKKIKIILEVTKEYSNNINKIEQNLIDKLLFAEAVSAKESIFLAKDIIAALNNRAKDVNELLSTNNIKDLYDAYTLIKEPLSFDDNVMNTVISPERIIDLPMLYPVDCGEILDELMLRIIEESDKVQNHTETQIEEFKPKDEQKDSPDNPAEEDQPTLGNH